jgi:putative methyltransferase (TIGR04325 family)
MAREGDEIRILDFGGAAGAHYFNMRSLVSKSIKLKWVVVETEEMVRQAEQRLSSDELSFVTTIEQAAESLRRVDLVTTSGAVQYLSDPIAYVRKLVSCEASYISFDRLCLTRGTKDLYVTHKTFVGAHGPGPAPSDVQKKTVNVPSVIVQLPAFLVSIQERYSIIATQDDNSGVLPIPGEDVVGLSCIARRV